ncbi:hypothetical protein Ancab_039268, partial [Ancistrocladus abbreviatus]
EANIELARPYTVVEVEVSLQQMYPTKAPGPDDENHEIEELKCILQVYKAASGQQLNLDKSEPPPNQHYKINADASIDKSGTIGLGFVIRDSEGRVQASGCSSKQMAVSSTVAEVLALSFIVETIQA